MNKIPNQRFDRKILQMFMSKIFEDKRNVTDWYGQSQWKYIYLIFHVFSLLGIKHWFKKWLGSEWCQAFFGTNADVDKRCKYAALGLSGLSLSRIMAFQTRRSLNYFQYKCY